MEILYPEGEKSCGREASVRQVSVFFVPVWYGQRGVEKDPRMMEYNVHLEYINFIKFVYDTILVESD